MHIANFAEGGQFEPKKIAIALRTSAEEIARFAQADALLEDNVDI